MVLATKKNCQRVLAASLRVVSAMTGNPPLGLGVDDCPFKVIGIRPLAPVQNSVHLRTYARESFC